MKRKILYAVIFFLCATLLAGCREYDQIEYISDTLGVDISHGTVLTSWDDHGGFHGEGLLAVTVSYTPEQAQLLLTQFEEISVWHPFPLSENVATALYGKTTGNSVRTALIRDYSTEEILVPEMENGWYFFYDRHSDAADPLDDTGLFSRNSYNCTIAVFDLDSLTLYFFEIDT